MHYHISPHNNYPTDQGNHSRKQNPPGSSNNVNADRRLFCAGLHAAELKRMRAHIFIVRISYIFTVMLSLVYLETEHNYILVECSLYERKREGKRGRGRGRVMAVDLLSKLHSKLVKVSQYHSQSEVDCSHGLCPQVLSVLTGVDQ